MPGSQGDVCGNHLDDDCDGQIDESCTCQNGKTKSCTTSLPGACSVGTQTCSANQRSSCEPDISVGFQQEVCGNTVDEDCDGVVATTATRYKDTDGDGYGGSTTTQACTKPVGYVQSSGDCNDTNNHAFP